MIFFLKRLINEQKYVKIILEMSEKMNKEMKLMFIMVIVTFLTFFIILYKGYKKDTIDKPINNYKITENK